jgi:sulfur-oxidizing protein SoxB
MGVGAGGRAGHAIWDVVTEYLKSKKTIAAPKLNLPKLVGVEGNPGIA